MRIQPRNHVLSRGQRVCASGRQYLAATVNARSRRLAGVSSPGHAPQGWPRNRRELPISSHTRRTTSGNGSRGRCNQGSTGGSTDERSASAIAARTARTALIAFTFTVIAVTWPVFSRWREHQFRNSLTPWQHYDQAMRLCRAHTQSNYGQCSKDDLNALIHHLEVIPEDSPPFAQATDLLSLLRIQRDRPQDFEIAERSRFQKCMARVKAQGEVEARMRPCPGVVDPLSGQCIIIRCGNTLRDACAPFATNERYAQLEASLSDPR